jgi:hypothetical protein
MTIELSEKETNLILKGLGELPAKESIELIIKLRMTWNEQEEVKQKEGQ